MTAQHSDELIRAFIAEGRNELPDRTFDAVRGEIHRTHQRAVLGPWRVPDVTNFVRVAFAAAVVGAIALAWVNLGPRNDLPGASPGPSPTPTIAPSATPAGPPNLTPGPLCAPVCSTGTLDPGTYSFEVGTTAPVRVSFTVPAGWATDADAFITKHAGAAGEVFFTTWEVTDVYPDACHHQDSAVIHAGTTSAELASLLAAQKGQVASATTDVTVGGFPAKHLELTVPADLDLATCTDGIVRPWPDPGPNFGGGYCCFPAGSIDDLSIVDAPGHRVVIVARHQPGSSASDVAELQGIVDSIAIEAPPGASPAGASSAP